MPDGDGLETTRRITEDVELHSRVVILTTFERDEYMFEALRSGASGFLLKNAPPEELLHAVHVVTAGEALLAPSVTRRLVEQFARRPVRPELGTWLDALTEREREVLRMLAHGKSNAELAAELFVTEGTIKTHVSSLLAKLGLRDRVQAVVLSGGLANQRTVGQRARHEHCLGHPSLVRRTPVIARRSSRWTWVSPRPYAAPGDVRRAERLGHDPPKTSSSPPATKSSLRSTTTLAGVRHTTGERQLLEQRPALRIGIGAAGSPAQDWW